MNRCGEQSLENMFGIKEQFLEDMNNAKIFKRCN